MKYNRRDFLKISYSASMGLMIGVALPVKNRLLGENLVQETGGKKRLQALSVEEEEVL